jgi:hypothetical protein
LCKPHVPLGVSRGVSPWGRRPERSEEGRLPERSKGCTTCARQDKKGRSAGQSRGLFLNSLSRTISFKKVATLFCREKPCPPVRRLIFSCGFTENGEELCLRLGVTRGWRLLSTLYQTLIFLLNMSCLDLPYIKKPPGRGGRRGDENG